MKNTIASAFDAISAVFDALAGDGGAITGEKYAFYADARDAILARAGITLQDYVAWCEAQEAAN